MYINIRRPSLTRRSGHERSVASQPYLSTQLPSMTGISPPSFVTPQQNPHLPYHASSESTLRSIARSKQSSNHLSSPSAAAPSVYSDEGTELNHQQPIVNTNPDNFEVALDDYHEHFRNLVSQITRETEDALEPAVNEASSTNVGPPPSTDFYLSRIPPTIGYDEFGRPYPADEHVPILNGYVRRMPTIESMGSRELGSMAPSVLSHSDTAMTASIRSSLPISRPPTRANTLESHFGSRPSSRTNSIAAGAELLLGVGKTSEVGELLDRSAGTASSGSSYPSTYYTATSNGSITSAHPSPTPGS
ncbi:hypothetical protein H0H87_007398 [Tephrocybe sp. NHM501043]|nr:hypothetical protein H0H87_007398 [Tephrocybe sp. NHM501043]